MLQVNFIMIYIIHKISVLLKITRILKRFLRSIVDFYIKKKKLILFTTYNDGNSKAWRKKHLSRQEKENKEIKDRIIREIRNLFEYKEEDYYKPIRVGNFWSKNYIEYKIKATEKH